MVNRAWIGICFLTGGRWAGLFKRQGMGRGLQGQGMGRGIQITRLQCQRAREVPQVLDLHDEACENAVTTDWEQPLVSCSVKNYISQKDIPRVRAPSPKNRRLRSPARNRAPMKDISHRHRVRSQNRARVQKSRSSRESRWQRAAANRASKPMEPLRPLEVTIPLSILTDNSYMDLDRLNFIKRVHQLGSCSLGIPPPTKRPAICTRVVPSLRLFLSLWFWLFPKITGDKTY